MKSMFVISRKYAHIILLGLVAAVIVVVGIRIVLRSRGSVVINEVCTSNVACCEDENGNYPDWIEIYNPTGGDIDLSGYCISKSTELNKEKFMIPDGTILASGSFYLFDPQFTLSIDGCAINLMDKNRNYVDNVRVPRLKYDTTFSRMNDGRDDWVIKTPTPGYSNTDGEQLAEIIDGSVEPSVPAGFYDEEFNLELKSSNWGRDVYYTTDGSDPKTNGILYESPILINDRSNEANVYSAIADISVDYLDGSVELPSYPVDKCTVVRAVCRDYFGRFTDVSTFSYFVGYNTRSAYDDMTVVAISADPDALFSSEKGIMVLGNDYADYVAAGEPEEYESSKANFTRKGRTSEREVSVEIFDDKHQNVVSSEAGLRIKGLSTRWNVQKSLSVIFRPAYGGSYKESFVTDGNEFDVHSFVIDKCGQDNRSKMRDAIMDKCMIDSKCLVKRSVPCCMFLNGEYWGFYWLTDRFDNSLVADRYGVSRDDVVFVTGSEFESDADWNMENFDRESVIEYYAANIITAHCNDWPAYNIKYWKTVTDEETKYGDGKWRPVIFDMNSSSMKDPEYDGIEFMLEKYYPFIKYTEEDENFRRDIVSKIDEMKENEFKQEKVLTLIDDLYDRIHDQMILDYMRFTNSSETEAESSFDEATESVREFYRRRWDYLEGYKEKYLHEN